MSAPARPPHYYGGVFGNEAGGRPEEESGWLVDDIASTAKMFPDWIAEDAGTAIGLRVLEHRPLQRVVVGWQAAAATGTVEARPDASGYVLVVARLGEREVFRAYLDRPYEEYEMWPPGAAPERDEEGPGRMGKHRNWVSFRAAAWPILASLANAAGGVNIVVDEAKLAASDG
jgi:hypothetical protein